MCNDEQSNIHLGEIMILFTQEIVSSNSTSSTDTTNKDTVCFTQKLVKKSQSCLHA